MSATREEELIVFAVRKAVGDAPVILAGSRATGEASSDSDYDVVVVVGALRIPVLLRRLRRVGSSLGGRLGADVSLNPVPPLRLRHPGQNLFLWKLRRDGRVLTSPRDILGPAPAPKVTPFVAFSYLLSGVIYLIEDLDPHELGAAPLRPELLRGVRKALLHLVQLRLLREGRYAARLGDALHELGDGGFDALAAVDSTGSWFSVRDRLLADLARIRRPDGMTDAAVANVRYAVLSALRGCPRWRAAATRRPVDERLAAAAVHLAAAVREDGSVGEDAVSRAAAALPSPLAPVDLRWSSLRDVVVAEWRNAHPLLAL